MAVTPAALSNEMSLQMRPAAKEQLTEKSSDFLQNVSVTEGVKEIVKMEHTSDRPEEKDTFSKNLQADFLHEMDTKIWDRLEQGSKHSQDPPSNPDEQEVTLVCEDPQDSLSPFSEKSTPALTPENSILKLSSWNAKMGLQMKELGADHVDWLEKINGIIQKINNTESTVKSLLTEVISLENQSEHLEDPDQETNVEVDACNEARELKEKLIERIEEARTEALPHGLCDHHHWPVVLHAICGRHVSLRKGAAQRAGAPHHVGASGDDGAFPEFGSRRFATILKIQMLLIPESLPRQ
ncbi:single-pass membrane and coiled-coil domain-containing protein 2 isoform X5 [Peromyscus maniculatus bairdii]|uniref:single-pass membrane and coiled-coil domain-containing protein 2 isoform X5 n=1 Tax=Peromyscus maniculatus bairdii TaxID=230844 RepID=UPI001C2E4A73|nr:single-pass membrane and coiled-coil domain-containing protein 2 isoform X5 [Peromyscus maniculatus bairdii]